MGKIGVSPALNRSCPTDSLAARWLSDADRCGAAVRDLQRVLATPAVPKPTLELARATLDSIAIDGDATF